MSRVRLSLILLFAVLSLAGGEAAAAPSGCCVGNPPTYSYDASTRKLTITFDTPADSRPNFIVFRTSGTLGPDGVITGDRLSAPGVDIVSPYRYDVPAFFPDVFYFQVVFFCALTPPTSCPGGDSMVVAPPVKVDLAASAPSAAKPQPVTASLARVPRSNGTKACEKARSRIKQLNGEIRKAVANLNFVNKLDASETQKLRRQQLQKRLGDLQRQLAVAVAAGKKAC